MITASSRSAPNGINSGVRELKGLPSIAREARGRAVIVLSSKDFVKVKKGDVLVASMTTPDFVSVMEKAIAIVTDEGGHLCPRGDRCRELRIPCVTGTRFATKALRDGDEVDVDANNGVVVKIEAKSVKR